MSKAEYIGFELTIKFRKEIERFIEENGYTTISEFVRECVRNRIKKNNNKINGGKGSKREK